MPAGWRRPACSRGGQKCSCRGGTVPASPRAVGPPAPCLVLPCRAETLQAQDWKPLLSEVLLDVRRAADGAGDKQARAGWGWCLGHGRRGGGGPMRLSSRRRETHETVGAPCTGRSLGCVRKGGVRCWLVNLPTAARRSPVLATKRPLPTPTPTRTHPLCAGVLAGGGAAVPAAGGPRRGVRGCDAGAAGLALRMAAAGPRRGLGIAHPAGRMRHAGQEAADRGADAAAMPAGAAVGTGRPARRRRDHGGAAAAA